MTQQFRVLGITHKRLFGQGDHRVEAPQRLDRRRDLRSPQANRHDFLRLHLEAIFGPASQGLAPLTPQIGPTRLGVAQVYP